MGEHGERVGALDEADYLGQVLPDDPDCWALLVQVRRPGEVLAERQAVERTEHSVKLTGAEQPCDDSGMPVWFAQLDPADDVQARNLLPASLQALQICPEIQFRRSKGSLRRRKRVEMLIGIRAAAKNCLGPGRP
jgi:hypothetical protein